MCQVLYKKWSDFIWCHYREKENNIIYKKIFSDQIGNNVRCYTCSIELI